MTQVTDLSGNSVSRVWIESEKGSESRLFKNSPKHLMDNEVYALKVLEFTGFVPKFIQIDDETICMEIIKEEDITDVEKFKKACLNFMNSIRIHQLRHGDLTRPHIIPVNNSLVVIDWAESRLWNDPRPDKRREGDWFWLRTTMKDGWGILI